MKHSIQTEINHFTRKYTRVKVIPLSLIHHLLSLSKVRGAGHEDVLRYFKQPTTGSDGKEIPKKIRQNRLPPRTIKNGGRICSFPSLSCITIFKYGIPHFSRIG
jgi:hypothetical protein